MRHLYEDFGLRLRDARRKAGMTQAALAARVGVSRTSVTNIERGSQHISLHMLFALALALGLKPAQLLPSETTPEEDVTVPRELRVWESDEKAMEWMRAIVGTTGQGKNDGGRGE